MLYVEFATDHARQIPAEVLAVGAKESDPDRRTVAMLGGRCSGVAVMSNAKEKAA
jgi:hypothetical protein